MKHFPVTLATQYTCTQCVIAYCYLQGHLLVCQVLQYGLPHPGTLKKRNIYLGSARCCQEHTKRTTRRKRPAVHHTVSYEGQNEKPTKNGESATQTKTYIYIYIYILSELYILLGFRTPPLICLVLTTKCRVSIFV